MNARTDTLRIAVIDGEVLDDTTRAIRPPWLRPPVTAIYRRENRLARRARIFRASPFARHLVAAADVIVETATGLAWGAVAGLFVAALFVGFPELAAALFAAIGAGQ